MQTIKTMLKKFSIGNTIEYLDEFKISSFLVDADYFFYPPEGESKF